MTGGPGYCIYRPQAPALVKQTVHTLFFDYGVEALYAVAETSLIEVEWVPVAYWYNDSGSSTTYTQPIETKHVVTSNKELSDNLNLPSTFSGLFVTFDKSYKSFRSQETVQPTTINVNVAVPNDRTTVVYQQRWKFSTKVWFRREHEGNQTVGVWGPCGSQTPLDFTIESYIDSDGYMIRAASLPSGSWRHAETVTVPRVSNQLRIVPFENVGDRCRKTLLGLGAA